jgi:hypothetical protein
MNDFADFVGSGFEEAGGVFGMVRATLLDKPLEGILDQTKLDRSLSLDGEKAAAPATFMVTIFQLRRNGYAKPYTRALEGKRLSIGAQVYRIEAVALDECNATFTLDDASR